MVGPIFWGAYSPPKKGGNTIAVPNAAMAIFFSPRDY